MKKKSLIGILVVILVIIGGLVYYKLDNDRKIKLKNEKITANYDSFKKSLKDYNLKREKLYNDYLDNTYLVDLPNKMEEIRKFYTDYYNLVKKIKEDSKFLVDNCSNYKGKEEIKNKCTAFLITYEQINNYYITEVKEINGIIEKYNLENAEKIELIEALEKSYIDFDKDGKFSGKEDNE